MADNIVEITVRSKNDTRAGFDAAKADAEAAGEEAGIGFMNKFGQGLASGQANFATQGGSGDFAMSALKWPAIAAAAVLLSPLIAGIVNGLVAATAGVGALAIVALPTFEKIKNAYTAVGTAQAAYNTAVEKEKIAPTKANATAVATALTNLKVAQEQAGPGTLKIIDQIHQLGKSFDAIGQSMQPQLLGIFNTALGVAAQLMPVVATFAKAAAPAVQQIMTALSKSINSTGFKDFVTQFSKLIGPSIGAVGTGIGKVMVAIGKLLTVMSAHDVVHALNIAFDTLAIALNIITGVVSRVMSNWDRMSGAFERAKTAVEDFTKRAGTDLANWAQVFDNIVGNVNNWFNVTLPTGIATAINWFEQLPGKIVAALAKLGDMLFSAGQHAIQRLIDGLGSMLGSLGSMAATVASKIAGFFGLSPAKEGPLSGSGAPEIRGAHFVQDFAKGMRGSLGHVAGASGLLAGTAGSPAGAGAGGGASIRLYIDPSFASIGLSKQQLQAIRYEVRTKGGGSVQAAFGKAGM